MKWKRLFSISFTSPAVGIFCTGVMLGIFHFQPPIVVFILERLELVASDIRFQFRGTIKPGKDLVIAAIDEKSIDQLGRWPWPYTVQAELINRLRSYGARVITYDVVFSSSDTSGGIRNLNRIKAKMEAEGIGRGSPPPPS